MFHSRVSDRFKNNRRTVGNTNKYSTKIYKTFNFVSVVSTLPGTSKGKAEHLYSALHGIQPTLKRSGMDHKEHNACLYLVSVHQTAPPPTEVENI